MNPRVSKEERIRRGTYRQDRDPKPARHKSTLLAEIPEADLTPEELDQFTDICQIKIDRKELTATDAKEIEILCKLMTRRDDLLNLISEKGWTMTFASGARQLAPEVTALDRIEKMITVKFKLLGLDAQGSRRLESKVQDDGVDIKKQEAIRNDLLNKLKALS